MEIYCLDKFGLNQPESENIVSPDGDPTLAMHADGDSGYTNLHDHQSVTDCYEGPRAPDSRIDRAFDQVGFDQLDRFGLNLTSDQETTFGSEIDHFDLKRLESLGPDQIRFEDFELWSQLLREKPSRRQSWRSVA